MTTDVLARLTTSLANHYTIERELGGGGMARVFVALDLALERRVVIKVLDPAMSADLSVERFAREIRLAATLQQANIVPLLNTGDADGMAWYSMPFVDGLSLRSRLANGLALPATETISVLRDLARALAYAHDRGVVHRDIKPDNILLSGGTAMVADFGIAKAVSAARTQAVEGTLTQLGTAIGTPAYMAPEQAAGDPDTDHRADIYAFGCVAYELLTGAAPFSGTAHQMVRAHIADAPASLLAQAAIPPRLASLVMHCLAKDPAARPQSARELLDALSSVDSLPTIVSTSAPASGAPVRRAPVFALLLLAVTVAGAGAWYIGSRNVDTPGAAATTVTAVTTDTTRSIAVLPLTNVSGDTAVQYFADGMTEEVTNALARVPGLRVASRASTMAFQSRDTVGTADIAKKLGVRTLLEGSVRRQGNRIRVTVQLTNAADGILVWSERYDADARDVFDVQDSIARSIAARLQITVDRARPLAVMGTTNMDAYDRYSRARFLANQYTRPALEQSIVLFREALALDPRYAQAWVGIAMSLQNLADSFIAPREAYPKAQEALRAALAIDSTLPDTHAHLGALALNYYWDIPLAKRELERALALDPQSLDALRLYAVALTVDQRPESAVVIATRGIRLDPTDGLAAAYGSYALATLGRNAEADTLLSRSLQLNPENPLVNIFQGFQYMRLGRTAEARPFFAKSDYGRPLVAVVDAHLGRRDAALQVARALEAERATHYVAADMIGAIYGELGDTNVALKWVAVAIEERSANMVSPNLPYWNALAGSSRFQALMRTRKVLR